MFRKTNYSEHQVNQLFSEGQMRNKSKCLQVTNSYKDGIEGWK